MRIIRNLTLLLIAGVLFTACSGEQKADKKVDFVYVDWAEGVAMVYVAKALLEEKGYQVNLMKTEVAPLFATLSKGNADVFLEAWLPTTHKEYMDKHRDSLESLGSMYDGAKMGLVVPSYVDVQSIEELNTQKDEFGGQIVGIQADAGVMKRTEVAIIQYELDYQLLVSSEAGMTKALKEAVDQKQAIVVTGWTPHWMFSNFDLKILEDTKGVYGKAETIEAVARKGFSAEQPFAATLIENMKFSDGQLAELMQIFKEGNDNDHSASTWIKSNRELVNGWMPVDEEMKEVIETLEILR